MIVYRMCFGWKCTSTTFQWVMKKASKQVHFHSVLHVFCWGTTNRLWFIVYFLGEDVPSWPFSEWWIVSKCIYIQCCVYFVQVQLIACDSVCVLVKMNHQDLSASDEKWLSAVLCTRYVEVKMNPHDLSPFWPSSYWWKVRVLCCESPGATMDMNLTPTSTRRR